MSKRAIAQLERSLKFNNPLVPVPVLRAVLREAERAAELERRIATARAELKRGLDGFAGLRDVAQWARAALAPRNEPTRHEKALRAIRDGAHKTWERPSDIAGEALRNESTRAKRRRG